MKGALTNANRTGDIAMGDASFYVIYYGWLIEGPSGAPNGAARTIAAAKPEAIVAMFYTFTPRYPNLSVQVRGLLHNAGTRVFAYVDTAYGNRPLNQVAGEAVEYLVHGVDGVFFDRVYNFLDDKHTVYYQKLYHLATAHGKTVIANTGVAQCGEAIMDHTDILMVEHDWRRLYRDTPWHARYPAGRFMGNSSNEPDAETFLGHPVACQQAVEDTLEAWSNGIGWHTSTDRYIELPMWFSTYLRGLGRSAPTEAHRQRAP